MAHAITTVLDAVVAAVTGLPTTGANVFKERPAEYALAETELDALKVWEEGEDAAPRGTYPGNAWRYERALALRIEAVTKRVSAYGDRLRQIALEVEGAFGTPITIGGRKFAVIYRGCDMADSAEGDQPVGVRRMRFEVQSIFTASNAPDALT